MSQCSSRHGGLGQLRNEIGPRAGRVDHDRGKKSFVGSLDTLNPASFNHDVLHERIGQ